MGQRRKARELAMQMLYQSDLGKQTAVEVRRVFWKSRQDDEGNQTVDLETQSFAEDLFRVAMERSNEIDDLIDKHSQNWRVHRMAVVDRNLLRTAIAEMIAFKGTPHPIIINEALEIGRKYAAPESITFLNGVLDAVSRSVMEERYS
ncbi:transcription antitermination factor NusB [Terriglobus roseus]|uniref:Transcription antitermination protein NusB n=1 Tax=Terriglobus roseus TaxID=392734 RepID=A0A1G7LM15_9BACT|nr:transcription antitermination factor NusB [Terriglobus roseus]SDF50040.1 NusB antitermination factor [Terriglobus roseus]